MWPVFRRMRTQPAGRWTVTVLATDPVTQFERLGLLLGGYIERVTYQAPGGLGGRFAEIQNSADTQGNVVLQHIESSGVLVLRDPDGVFVLENSGGGLRLHAAVATTGRASTGAVVLTCRDRFLLVKRRRRLRSLHRSTWG